MWKNHNPYTGTIFVTVFNHKVIPDTKEVYNICKKELKDDYDMEVLEPTMFNNTYTIAVTNEEAAKYGIKFKDVVGIDNSPGFTALQN